MSGTHDGHRKRLKERFLQTGLRGFAPHEALELLLCYAIPRKDTNGIAHRLIDTFGSFERVLNADYEALKRVEGVGENSALLIKLTLESCKYYLASQRDERFTAASTTKTAEFSATLFAGEVNEVSYLLCFDMRQRLINCTKLAEGSVNATEISVRRVVELAALHRAATVILVHNHPDGVAMPSAADISTTKRIFAALAEIGVTLDDHIIVGAGGETISFAENGGMLRIKGELGKL